MISLGTGCVEAEPLYCDGHTHCVGGQRCNYALRRCEAVDQGAATDQGAEAGELGGGDAGLDLIPDS